MSRERFYAERDRRTAEYGVDADPLELPVAIVIGAEAASSVAGQTSALALVNMAARIHRRLRIVVPEVQLLVPCLVSGSSLPVACEALIRSIDPFNDLVVTGTRGPSDALPHAAIGVGTVPGVPLAVGADRFAGTLTDGPAGFRDDPSTIIGAGLAACLGAAALLRLAFGIVPAPRRVSLWDIEEGDDACAGDRELPQPLDVGDVAVIGAGAVSSGFAYWASQIGIVGRWIFVDGDEAELHNTNRAMGLVASDAGWAGGSPDQPRAKKAGTTAALLGARYYNGWYEEWLADDGYFVPDLVLPLANGPGLRAAISQRGEPLLVHAGTSRDWTADLFRHLAETDGCICCRLPPQPLVPDCSKGRLPVAGVQSNDAALPFLSGAAGLLLVNALVQLSLGRLQLSDYNHWRLLLDLNASRTVTRARWSCRESCSLRRNLPQELRRTLPRGRRWAFVD